MHQRELKCKMPKRAHGHESLVEIVLEIGGLQVIIAKAEAVFCDDITGESIESVAQGGNAARIIGCFDALAHKLYLLLDDGFELGNTSFGEHWIQWSSPDCMEVTLCCCECHCIGAESSRHPLIFIISIGAGVELIPIIAVLHVEFKWGDTDNGTLAQQSEYIAVGDDGLPVPYFLCIFWI